MVFDLVLHALMAWLAFTLCSDPQSAAVTRTVRAYDIADGDTLSSVGARFGVEPRVLAKDTGPAPNAQLRTGDRLIVVFGISRRPRSLTASC